MVALLGELVSKGEPVFLYEGLEPVHRTIVRVKENLCQGNNLKERRKDVVVYFFVSYNIRMILSTWNLPCIFGRFGK